MGMGGVQSLRYVLMLLLCLAVTLISRSGGFLRDITASSFDLDLLVVAAIVSAPREAHNQTKEPSFRHGGDMSTGILSERSADFFRDLQETVDQDDNVSRCLRYRFTPPSESDQPKKRRIFYGSLIADESWELFEIVAAETNGIFEAMVFVESNRTQNFSHRRFKRLNHTHSLQALFGTERVQIRSFVNEDPSLNGLSREHKQRAEIIKGWKDLGMTQDDVGLLADADETFTRDFLRAIQVCNDIPLLNYEKHRCRHGSVKLKGKTLVFESSPECIAKQRTWFHPDMIIGYCIEGIGNETMHPKAPRIFESYHRAKGFGSGCDAKGWANETAIADDRYPLYDASDFRRTCAGHFAILNPEEPQSKYGRYTGFHFHNFFADANAIRFKYRTFGHGVKDAYFKPLGEMSNDLRVMYNCARNITDDQTQKWKRLPGGFNELLLPLPIYFQDAIYREKRHQFIETIVTADEKERIAKAKSNKLSRKRRHQFLQTIVKADEKERNAKVRSNK